MRHKKYNKLIDIKSRTYSSDDLGDKTVSSTITIASCWANIDDMSSTKVNQYSQVAGKKTITAKIHYPQSFSMSKDYFVTYGSVNYEVLDFNSDARKHEMIIDLVSYD